MAGSNEDGDEDGTEKQGARHYHQTTGGPPKDPTEANPTSRKLYNVQDRGCDVASDAGDKEDGRGANIKEWSGDERDGGHEQDTSLIVMLKMSLSNVSFIDQRLTALESPSPALDASFTTR